MKLKCIGGPNDNEYWEVSNNLRDGNIFPINQLPKTFVVDFDPGNLSDPPKVTETHVEYYKLACFSDGTNRIKFLVHQSLSYIEALKLQLEKTIPEKHLKVIKTLINDFGFEYSLTTDLDELNDLRKYLKMEEIT